MRAIPLSIALILAVTTTTEGCHGTPPAPPPEDNDENQDVSSRRRRSAIAPDDARKDLSDFFTQCMVKKGRPGVIESMRSVVEWVLRDAKWYEILDQSLCSGDKDTRECWNNEADGLIDWSSELLGQLRECLLVFASRTTVGGYRKKRGTNMWSEIDRTQSSRPDPPCPQVTDDIYGECMEEEINITASYPSFANFHWESIATFLREHYSRCRYELVFESWRPEGYTYRKTCPPFRYRTTAGDAARFATQQCVPFLHLDLIREGAPLRVPTNECNERFSNVSMIVAEEDDDDDSAEGTMTWDEEVKQYGPRGKHNGADIVGYCDPKAAFTTWFDTLDEAGDSELLAKLRFATEGFMCSQPSGIQIRVSSTDEPWYTSGNNLKDMSPQVGLHCLNSMQHNKPCENFKVRFCCLQPTGSQNGATSNSPSYPKTASTVGTCGPRDRWGYWKNIDSSRTNGGDFELFQGYGMPNCDPVAVQGRIRGNNRAYTQARNNLRTEDPRVGIVCADGMQPRERPCRDFEVRFCCKDGRGIVAITPRPPPVTTTVWMPIVKSSLVVKSKRKTVGK